MAVKMTPAAEKVLAAAGTLFYERGIHGVGVDLLAEEAGVTKKTLYDRFGSKEGLVVAYLEARAARWQRHAEAALRASDATGAERVLVVLDALESWMADATRGCGFVNAYAELSGSAHRGTRCVREEKAQLRALYTGLVADAGLADPGTVGRLLALVHEGAIVDLTAGDSRSALDDARSVVRLILERYDGPAGARDRGASSQSSR